jgi:hypothetical protein
MRTDGRTDNLITWLKTDSLSVIRTKKLSCMSSLSQSRTSKCVHKYCWHDVYPLPCRPFTYVGPTYTLSVLVKPGGITFMCVTYLLCNALWRWRPFRFPKRNLTFIRGAFTIGIHIIKYNPLRIPKSSGFWTHCGCHWFFSKGPK